MTTKQKMVASISARFNDAPIEGIQGWEVNINPLGKSTARVGSDAVAPLMVGLSGELQLCYQNVEYRADVVLIEVWQTYIEGVIQVVYKFAIQGGIKYKELE